MPQLWIETFVTQYFWFLLTFLTLYLFIHSYLLPRISLSYKARVIQKKSKLIIKKAEEGENISNNYVLRNVVLSLATNISDLNKIWFEKILENTLDLNLENIELDNGFFEYEDWEIGWDNDDQNLDISEDDI
jgi:hypothetical protein